MMNNRDVQHRFHVDGRTYVVEVCAPSKQPAPISVGPFDVHIAADVPANFDDYGQEDVDDVVRHIVDYIRPLMPPSVSALELDAFSASVCGWVCTHRTALMLEDWHLERQELENGSTYAIS